MAFTREGRLTLGCVGLLAFVGLMQGELLFFLLCCLVLGAAVASRWLAKGNLNGIQIARRLPHRSRVGLPTPLRYDVETDRRRAAVGLEIEDRTGTGVEPRALLVELPVIREAAPARCVTHVRFRRRGLYVVDAVTLTSRFPLGLSRARRDSPAAARCLVHPAEGRVTARLRDRLRGLSLETARPQTLWRGDDVLFGVREYRDGDDPRRIHWRTTARRGAVCITEWRAQEEGEVVLVLGRATGAGPDMASRFERAVSVTATVWRMLAGRRVPATLVLDATLPAISTRDRAALIQGLDALARVDAQRRRPLDSLTAPRGGYGRSVVYVGCGPEPEAAERLAIAAGRRGDVLHLRADRGTIKQWVGGIA